MAEKERRRGYRVYRADHTVELRQMQTSGVHGLFGLRSSAPTEHGILLDSITLSSESHFYSAFRSCVLLTLSDSTQT